MVYGSLNTLIWSLRLGLQSVFRILILFSFIFLMGCQNDYTWKGKIFSKQTPQGTIYLVFGGNRIYKQYFIGDSNDSSIGYYSDGEKMFLYDFVMYDKELQDILYTSINKQRNANGIPMYGSLQVYPLNKYCIYFHPDISHYQFCQIEDLPANLKNIIIFP